MLSITVIARAVRLKHGGVESIRGIKEVKLSDFVGKEIIAEEPTEKSNRKYRWIVVAAYPSYVKAVRICENGEQITQCFSVGDLVAMGLIKVRKVSNTQGYRFARKGYEGKI